MSARYINRELSWIEFNARVLAEAENPQVPLLERLTFLTIVANNFDEFFMVRVASVKRQVLAGRRSACPTGKSPRSQLKAIHTRAAEVIDRMYSVLLEEVLPGLTREGIVRVPPEQWTADQRAAVQARFRTGILPVLTPLRLETGLDRPAGGQSEGGTGGEGLADVPLPPVGNLSLHAAFLLTPVGEMSTGESSIGETTPGESSNGQAGTGVSPEEKPGFRVALVPIPAGLERIIYLPHPDPNIAAFTTLEQVVIEEGDQLFPGYTVTERCLFRVTRDADMSVDEERDEDFVAAMEQVLETRDRSRAVRLSINHRSSRLQAILTAAFVLDPQEVYPAPDPLELAPFLALTRLDGYDHLRNDPWRPQHAPAIDPEAPVWESVRRRDVLLHFPYESFDPLVRLIREAAEDEDTLAIKITLYRVSGESPIVRALETAAQNGKQVTVVVELKARFDEQTNIDAAARLERAGAIVIQGIARLKVHAKALLVIRREPHGIGRYVYLGTGNFNDRTAGLYGDIGLLSAGEHLATEVGLVFNAITGYSVIPGLRQLVPAPGSLRPRLLELIAREGNRAATEGRGLIIAKMNSLADQELIDALYDASNQGARVLLNVRGICMLVPGQKGKSENIRVVSIVDRYLEHSRIFHFENGGSPETYLASADWMPRNLDKRVELMFPLADKVLQRRVREILDIYFADTVKAHELGPDGRWLRTRPRKKDTPLRAQAELYRLTRERAAAEEPENRQTFNVRRRAPGAGGHA